MSKTTSELTLTIVLGAFLVVSSGMRADSGQGPGEGWDDAQLLMIDEIQRDAIAIAIAIAAIAEPTQCGAFARTHQRQLRQLHQCRCRCRRGVERCPRVPGQSCLEH